MVAVYQMALKNVFFECHISLMKVTKIKVICLPVFSLLLTEQKRHMLFLYLLLWQMRYKEDENRALCVTGKY